MKHLVARIAAILVLFAPGLALPCSADPVPGIAFLAYDPAQDRPLSLSIWYPSDAGVSVDIGGNAVFAGASAALDASVTGGPFPLILLSHGGIRSAADSGAWLGASLATSGFMVVEINAPGPATAQAAVDEIWQRRRDISRALDMILGDPVWAGHVDPGRVSVVGFALGGTAALTVAGVEFDTAAYLRTCTGPKADGPDCAWYAAQGVALESVDHAQLGQPGWDSRVASAVAIAPEYLSAFRGEENVTDAPTLVIALGQQSVLKAPHARHTSVPDAQMFDAFASCTDIGSLILLEEGEDPALCGTEQDARAKIHEEITDAIREFLAG